MELGKSQGKWGGRIVGHRGSMKPQEDGSNSQLTRAHRGSQRLKCQGACLVLTKSSKYILWLCSLMVL